MPDKLKSVVDGLLDVITSFFVRILFLFNG